MTQLLNTDPQESALENQPESALESEQIPAPNIDHLVLEDDTPVDNFQSEKQQRLLVEPLYSSKALPAPFLAAANVGLFYKLKGDPVVPDAMLSLGVQCPDDFSQKQNRSYLTWEIGKTPEVCIEVVSNQEGDELIVSRRSQQKGKTTSKKSLYAQIGVAYYVVFDPLEQIQGESEMNNALLRVWTISPIGYIELTPPEGVRAVGESVWLEGVGLGLALWEGEFEQAGTHLWLRWCDRAGRLIPTGAEGQTEALQREADALQREADALQREAKQVERANRMADRLRAMGIDPDEM